MVCEEADACFVVRDHNGQTLAYVDFDDEPGRRSAAKLLSKDEARRIAVNIVKLPPRFLLLASIVLLIGDYSFAQDSPDPTPMQCQLIRSAVAQYGFAAARRHALETYGPEAVKTGDKCFTNVRLRLRARTKRHGE